MNHISKLLVYHHRAESDSDLNVYCQHPHSSKQNPCRGNTYTKAVSRVRAPLWAWSQLAGAGQRNGLSASREGWRCETCPLGKFPSLGLLLSSSQKWFGAVLLERDQNHVEDFSSKLTAWTVKFPSPWSTSWHSLFFFVSVPRVS